MMKRSLTRWHAPALMLAALLSIDTSVEASVIHWASPVDGNWTDPTKLDDGVPTATDDAVIDPAGAYTVALFGSQSVATISLDAVDALLWLQGGVSGHVARGSRTWSSPAAPSSTPPMD